MVDSFAFTPIHTQRLLIRPFELTDADGLERRRNDPRVAKYQNWALPFARSEVDRIVAELLAMGGPANEDWWMAIVCDATSGEVLGDLALHLSWESRTAEVGYTFDFAHWGRGYAVESVEALVAYAFEEIGVTRVCGMLHPDNPASAMVLERCGMLFEGHTRLSFWLDGAASDDWLYGMTRDDWIRWRERRRTPPDEVRLLEIDAGNDARVAALRTHKSQEAFVAPMCDSFRNAMFPEIVEGAPVVPWMRAVEADGCLVGFVMLALATDHHPEPFLWRLLLDRMHQRRGIGQRILGLIADECRERGNATMLTSWRDGKGSPGPFYLRNGFVPTGRKIDREVEARARL